VKACEKVANKKKANSVVQVTELHPFHPYVLSDEDFLPSEFSDWPKETGMRNQPAKTIRNYKCLCPPRKEQQRVIYLPVASRINHHLRAVKRRLKEHGFLHLTPFPCRKQNSHQEEHGKEAIRDNDMFSIQNFTPVHN
jgi:hypothetical protein